MLHFQKDFANRLKKCHMSCVVSFPVKVSCTPSLLSVVAWTGIPLHVWILMRFEDAFLQAQDLLCNPILLYDEQESGLFQFCTISFLPVNLWIVDPVSRCFAFLFFINKPSQSQAMDQILVLNWEDSIFAYLYLLVISSMNGIKNCKFQVTVLSLTFQQSL